LLNRGHSLLLMVVAGTEMCFVLSTSNATYALSYVLLMQHILRTSNATYCQQQKNLQTKNKCFFEIHRFSDDPMNCGAISVSVARVAGASVNKVPSS
jgi:hypothetical protein